jgi:GT2 family glycosyltransferase
VGGFDPLYFMYSEDVDLSRRAREQGSTLLQVPAATFHHEHSATGSAQALRIRHFTASATTLSYRYAPSRLRVLGVLARKRTRWFRTMAKERRWWQLGGAVLGSVVWLARLPEIERRRRRPWDREALLAWLDGVSEDVEMSPLR